MAMIITPNQDPDTYNKPIYGTHGEFSLSAGSSLPYFVAVLRIDRALDELRVAEEMTPSLENKWSLKELYQREVDRERVDREIVATYLKDPYKLKFFNGITVVLMPKKDGQLVDSFSETEVASPPIPFTAGDSDDSQWVPDPDGGPSAVSFGGVQYVRSGQSARLRWNLESVQAAVVDGQHRIVALRKYRGRDQSHDFTADQKRTGLTVLFLLLDEKAGLQYPGGIAKTSIKKISREIFTDLNKHARPVDQARELVLDDLSISALCVRDLVTDDVTADSEEKIPLALVRWQEPNYRFDEGYYFSSLVLLHALVEEYALKLPRIEKPDNPHQAEKYISAVATVLGGGSQLKNDSGDTLAEVYRLNYCDEDGTQIAPFSRLPSSFLTSALRGFREYHRPWIFQILTQFRPYAHFLQYARANDLIQGDFSKYHAQITAHRDAIKTDLQDSTGRAWYKETILTHIEEFERIKGMRKGDDDSHPDWSFKVVFVKAIFTLAREITFDNKGDDHNLGTLDNFLSFLNSAHSAGLFRVDEQLPDTSFGVWSFIATNPSGGKIKVSAQTENNIARLLRTWYYAIRKRKRDLEDGGEPKSAGATVKFLAAKSSTADWPECSDALEGLRRAFDKKGFYGPTMDEIAPEVRAKLVRTHLHHLVATALNRIEPVD